MSILSLTLFSEIYLPQKNQILALGYLVPLSVYYTLSNGQAVSHTHTPAVNVYTCIYFCDYLNNLFVFPTTNAHIYRALTAY